MSDFYRRLSDSDSAGFLGNTRVDDPYVIWRFAIVRNKPEPRPHFSDQPPEMGCLRPYIHGVILTYPGDADGRADYGQDIYRTYVCSFNQL